MSPETGPPPAGDAPGAPRVRPRRYGDGRLLLCGALQRISRLLGGRAWYRRRNLAPGRFELRRERIEVPDLPVGLEGLTLAQLSDLHAGAFLGEGDLEHVLRATIEAAPDLVVLTGDLITDHWRQALWILDDLAELQPPLGFYGVFGNHDYHGRDEHHIAAAYASRGIRFLRNECVRLDSGRGVLALIGLEDLEESKHIDVEGPRAELRAGDVEVVLCHNPGGAALLARPGCALVLSGHTHGGQLQLPGLRGLGPPHPGDRVRHGGTECITSRGLGALVLPLRVRARAEVVLIELVRAEGVP